jgi:outer membrane protein assembly factor BamB
MVGYGATALVTLDAVGGAGALYADYHPQAVQAAAQQAPGKVFWKITGASGKKVVLAFPTVAGTTLYAISGLTLAAYDLTRISSSGPARLWQKQYTPQFAFTSPAVYGDTLYFGLDSTTYAVSTKDGAKRWTASLPESDISSVNSTPVFGANGVYVLSRNGALYANSAKDGSALWNVPVEKSAHFLDHSSGPVVDGSAVYIGSLDHHVYAFNARDGSPLWKALTRGPIISSPAVVNGVVYIGSGDNYVYALNARDGSVKWKYLTGDDVTSSVAVVDGVVYVASQDHFLYALDAESGKPYWRSPIGDLDTTTNFITNASLVTCQPAITGDSVSVIDTLFFIIRSYNRADGSVRWTYTSKDNLQNADPISANGLVYFGSGDDTLYAFGA